MGKVSWIWKGLEFRFRVIRRQGARFCFLPHRRFFKFGFYLQVLEAMYMTSYSLAKSQSMYGQHRSRSSILPTPFSTHIRWPPPSIQQNRLGPGGGLGPRAVPKPSLAAVVHIAVVSGRAAVAPIQYSQFHLSNLISQVQNTHAAEQQLVTVAFPGHRYPFFPTPVLPHVPSILIDTPGLGA